MAFDLLIRGARVLDGTGAPARRADIGILRGVIEAVESLPWDVESAETLDASGLTAAPGFIDIHTHADIALLARPEHLPKVMQGVTTEVFTNCGLGFAPCTAESLALQREYLLGLFGDDSGVDWGWQSVAELVSRYESQGIGTNAAYLIPHGAVRTAVMGMAARPANTDELTRMETLVRRGMAEGAWGLSTGLWYAPMCHADHRENVALCRAAGFFATHQRSYAEDIEEATRESLAIARDAAVPVQISHLQMNGAANAGRAPDLLSLLDRTRAEGIDVTCDTYPYTAGSTFLQSLLPAWATDGGPAAILRRLSEADMRSRIAADLHSRGADWSRYFLVGVESAANRRYEGEPFDRIARDRGMSVAEWLCCAMKEESLQACYIHHAAHEGNVRDILRWPGQMVGSDGLHLRGKTHPRLYGTFPRILQRYVREDCLLPLEEAIRKMTSAPADRLGLKDRGRIFPGLAADLVLFDTQTVAESATFSDPLQFPEGIPHVYVNGIAVKRDGRATGARPGRVLRGAG